MAVLADPRHERFAQNLAGGMPPSEAYVAAGFKHNTGNACRLKARESVGKRVAELTQCGADVVVESLTLKQRLAAACYERALSAVPTLALETAQEVKALIDSGLSVDKDERILAGGANPDQPSLTVNVVMVEVDDVFRRVRPVVQIEQEKSDAEQK